MIARLRWESSRMGTFGHETLWRLMAGRTEVARVEPDYDVGGVMSSGTVYQHHSSIDDAKRAAEESVGATDTGSYELGRRDMRAEIVAWLKEQSTQATARADERISAGEPNIRAQLAWHTADCFAVAADELEAQGAAKAGDGA
jgi:hypothetical protein